MMDSQAKLIHSRIWDLISDYADIRDELEDAVLNCRSAAIDGYGFGANFEDQNQATLTTLPADLMRNIIWQRTEPDASQRTSAAIFIHFWSIFVIRDVIDCAFIRWFWNCIINSILNCTNWFFLVP